ncbi:MAG: ABC transporter substrate-binding protein [bacterium]
MNKIFLISFGLILVILSSFFIFRNKASVSENLIQISTADSGKWVGFAPFYLAKARGFDKKYGVNLKIEKVGNSDARRTMLSSGQIDFLTPTIDGAIFNINAGMDVKIIMAYDTSFGGDGIVSKNNIFKLTDLKGKRIAATKGFTNYFFLKYLLSKNGISDKDLVIVDMPDEQIGPAFVAGKIDAGAMMEPWISKITSQGKGKLLVSSKDTPNIVTDIILARSDSIKNKKTGLSGVAKAWFEALKYYQSNPSESNEIMAKEYGMSVTEFIEAVKTVKWLTREDNSRYFSHENNEGIYEITKSVIDTALKENMITKNMNVVDIITTEILQISK